MNFDFGDSSNVKPSNRDLTQFISPNPNSQNHILKIHETSGHDLEQASSQFEKWEEDEIAALIVDTTVYEPANGDEYLSKAVEALSCPIIRRHGFEQTSDLINSRLFGFHAQISPLGHLKPQDILALDKDAQSMNFRVMWEIQNKEDWAKVIALQPKFIVLHDQYSEPVPAQVMERNIWLVGSQELPNHQDFKCIIVEAKDHE